MSSQEITEKAEQLKTDLNLALLNFEKKAFEIVREERDPTEKLQVLFTEYKDQIERINAESISILKNVEEDKNKQALESLKKELMA